MKNNLREYKQIFKNIDKNKQIFAEKLYKEADFMFQTLTKLKEIIEKEGAVIETVNGNGFETTMEHPAQKSYNTMIKNYNATLKQLVELAPPAPKAESKLKVLMKE